MRRHVILAMGLLGVLLVLFIFWSRSQRVEPVVIALAPADQPNVLHEIGSVEALREASLLAQLGGDVLWMIEEGTFVEPGDPVVKFSTQALDDDIAVRVKDVLGKKENVRRAKAEIEFLKRKSEIQLRQLNIALEQAQLNRDRTFGFPNDQDKKDVELTLQSAEMEFQRLKSEAQSTDELADQGFVSESTRRQKQVDLAGKKINFAKAKLIRDLTLQGNSSDSKRLADMAVADAKKSIQIAEFNREQNLLVAQTNLELVEINLAVFEREWVDKQRDVGLATTCAKTRGRVAFVDTYNGGAAMSPSQVGENRPQNSWLCKICDTSNLRVNMFVNECDIHRVKLHQKATIELSAFPGRQFNAVVSALGAVASDKNVALSSLASRSLGEAFVNVVAVKLDFVDLSEADRLEIRLGFTCHVYLQLDSVPEGVSVK
jgi:multidrug efflux pump subunit AcrA (membrane-fusion protein)